MTRRALAAPTGMFNGIGRDGPVIPVGFPQMTLALTGLAIYLFCVHSFKLPIAAGGIAIGVLGLAATPKDITFPQPVLFFAAFLLWSTTGLVTSQFPGIVGAAIVDYLKILLIFFVAINSARTLSQHALLVALWVLMFGMYPARGTYFNFVSGIGDFGRYAWNFSFANFNDMAAYTILALSLSGFLFVGRFAKWIRIGGLISAIGLSLLVILTQSRGAFVGLLVAFVFLLVRSSNRARLIKFGTIASLCVVIAAPGAVWNRFARMKFLTETETIGQADTSAEQRFVILQIALTIAREHLGTGVGLGAYAETHAQYAVEQQEWAFGGGTRDAHNMYVSVAAETGVLGLSLFLGMLGSTLVRAARVEKRLRATFRIEAEQLRVLRYGLVAFLISAIFGSFHRVSFMYLFIAVLWTASELFERLLDTRAVAAQVPAPWTGAAALRVRGGPTMRPNVGQRWLRH